MGKYNPRAARSLFLVAQGKYYSNGKTGQFDWVITFPGFFHRGLTLTLIFMFPFLKFHFRINKVCPTGKSPPWGTGPFGRYSQGNYTQQNGSKSTPRQNQNTREAMVPRENRKIWGILATAGHPQLVVDSANSYGSVWMCRVVAYTRFSAVDEALPFRGKGPK